MARAFLRFLDRVLGRHLVRAIALVDRARAALRFGGSPAGSNPRNILVIKLVGLGDTVLMLTPLGRLRREFPDARITALVTPLSEGILSAQPSVDATEVYDVLGKERGLGSLLRVIRRLRRRKFDCVIDFEQHFQMTAFLSYFTGARLRIGLYYPGNPREGLFSHPVLLDPDRHMVEVYMALLGPLGIDPGEVEELEDIWVPPADREAAERWLAGRGIGADDYVVGIHSGSGPRATVRRWGVEKFADVIQRLRRERGAKIVLTGSADERDRVQEIADQAGVDEVHSASGDLSILQTVALMKRCQLFISNDTGPMHMSAAVGTPTIGLFGPNTPTRYAPVGKRNASVYKQVHCSPCIQIHEGKVETCKTGICMKEISAEDVWSEVLLR